MKNILKLQTMKKSISDIDTRIITFLGEHSYPLLALLVSGIAVWGLTSDHIWWFAVSLIIVGAIGYYVGITAAFVFGLIFAAVEIYSLSVSTIPVSTVFLEILGYGCVAWLGQAHREPVETHKEKSAQRRYDDQVGLPWTVANDILTSLAAVRYLLFPLQTEHSDKEILRIIDELSNLEQLFSQMESKERGSARKDRRAFEDGTSLE